MPALHNAYIDDHSLLLEVCACSWPMLKSLQACRQVILHSCSVECRVSSVFRVPALRQKRICSMPMRRSGSADLPAGAKLPATHAEASKGHKHQRRQRGFGLWDYYNRQLQKQPVITKGLTCFVGAVIGDSLAQWFTGLPYDIVRNLRMSMYGLIVGGPSGHYWHQFLEAYILPKRPTSRAAVICKLLVDQLLFAPVSTIMLFAALELMKGTPESIPIVIQDKLWPTMKANWAVWPLANFIAFRFLHQDVRILYANIVGIMWCAYVSLVFYAKPGQLPVMTDALP